MEIVKLSWDTLSPKHFSQMVQIEKNCGLEPYTTQMLQECITDMDTFACLVSNDLVGFVTVHAGSRYLGGGLYVVNLNVSQSFRRQGIGRQLMLTSLLQYQKTHISRPVLLDVRKDNSGAISLYSELGFTATDIPSGNGATDIVMTADLSDIILLQTTRRLVIRPMSKNDIPSIALLLQNEVIRRTYMIPDLSTSQATKLAQHFVTLSHDPCHYVRGIYLHGSIIGWINDTQISSNSIEIGWVINPTHHNCNYATEAVTAAVMRLLNDGFSSVVAGAFADNPASIRVMEKVGMQPLNRTEQIEYRGQIHECIYFGIHNSSPKHRGSSRDS